MSKALPVALVLFSNDLDRFLPMVERERKVIEEALEHFNDTNRLKVIARSSVSIAEIFRLFNRYRGRIALFHFAGHAGGKGLQLNENFTDNDLGRAIGLADLFRQEVENGLLQLVFLNGCSTHPQLAMLEEAGVPSVISTHHPIEDLKAIQFSQQFYRSLANSDQENPYENLPTLKTSFDRAVAYLKTAYDLSSPGSTRAVEYDFRGETQDGATWDLFSRQPDWRLSQEVADEDKVFNEHLTLALIQALPQHSKIAGKFMAKVASVPGWQDRADVMDAAKQVIASDFVGVLGIQLRKLFAIGKESRSDHKNTRYLQNCILTAQRALQLLSYALLSDLWNQQQQTPLSLTEPQTQQIQHPFGDSFGLDLQAYVKLLNTLCEIYGQNQRPLPLDELTDFLPQLADETADFRKTCLQLQTLSVRLDKGQSEMADCFVAERQLTVFLKALSFLASYRMVSMKHIAYLQPRNAAPRYLHSFTALGVDRKSAVNTERVNYAEEPIDTDAVLLFKGGYQTNINLFPFIIDLNALTFESGAKICFYHSQDLEDHSLHYRFLEDNSEVNVMSRETSNQEEDLNLVMMDLEKRKQRNLDLVWQQFQEIRKALLPGTSVGDLLTMEEEEDDFGF